MSVSVTQEFVRKPDMSVTRAVTVKSSQSAQIKNVHVQVEIRLSLKIFKKFFFFRLLL